MKLELISIMQVYNQISKFDKYACIFQDYLIDY